MVRNREIPSGHRLYGVFSAMKQRCYNPNCKNYPDYGGRGIKICKEWLNSYAAFFEWAINNGYAVGKHIDRIDNDMGYYPDNCRFVTPLRSLRNKRNVMIYEYNGEKRTLKEWAAYFDIPGDVLYNRIKNKKLPLELAINYKRRNKKDRISSASQQTGESIKRIIKRNGRFNHWFIKKFKEEGFNITECQFSNKLHGQKDEFSKDELEFIYHLFQKHEFVI